MWEMVCFQLSGEDKTLKVKVADRAVDLAIREAFSSYSGVKLSKHLNHNYTLPKVCVIIEQGLQKNHTPQR